MRSPSSNKVQKTKFWKEKSIEDTLSFGPTNNTCHTSEHEKAHVNLSFHAHYVHTCFSIVHHYFMSMSNLI
jgi:hypothetical protein